MTDWDERDLEHEGDDYEPSPGSEPLPIPDKTDGSLVTWPLIAAGVLALVAGLMLFWLFSTQGPIEVPETKSVEERPIPTTTAPPPVEEEPEPEADEPEVVLPSLSESDVYVREALEELSQHPALASFLLTEGLARKIVTAVVNIAEGENPATHFPYLALEDQFTVVRRGLEVYLDPRSYHRYDRLASGFQSLDADGLAAIYRRSKPLLDEAYAELGYPRGDFGEPLRDAIAILLQTPIVEDRIRLRADSVSYSFADPRLEALSPAQKQLLRTGPENTRKVQSKLREIAVALDLPAES